MNKSTTQRLTLVLAAFASSLALVQSAPAPTPAPAAPVSAKKSPVPVEPAAASSEEAVVLSPFVITSDKDNGYQATMTQAGTRLSTELKDVGASISVITSQFLQDTGATDTKSLLTYVTGSEVGGPAGNFSGGSPGVAGSSPLPSENLGPQATTRLRGLAGASETRNFYGTSIPLDGYNIDRVEVNRGANGILFGAGSPAGIVNSALKQATFKDSYKVEARYGSYEAYRGSFDLNKQIIRGELALRLDGLLKRTQYRQNYAFENDDRLYAAITYAPKWARTRNGVLSGTVFRANIESGNLDSRRPRVFTSQDAFSYWFEPYFPGNPVKLTWDAANARTNSPGVVQLTQATNVFRNPVVWFNNPGSSTPGTGSLAANGSEIVVRQGIVSNLPSALYPVGAAYWATPKLLTALAADARVSDGSLFLNPSLTDRSIFDYRTNLVEGPNRFEYANFEASNVTLEQRFLKDRAGVEFAFDKQSFISGSNSLGGASQRIQLDINTSLLDGRPNPNFGRPFICGYWTTSYSKSESRVGRATGYYKLDAAELLSERWARWLGNITGTLLYEQSENRSKALSGHRYASPDDWNYSNNQLVSDNNGGLVSVVAYLGPSLANASTARGANIPSVTSIMLPSAANGKTWQVHSQNAGTVFLTTSGTFVDDGLVPNNLATGANQGGNNFRNTAGIIQHKLLQDALVVTLGWRRDNVDSFTAPAPRLGGRGNLIVNDGTWVLPSRPTTSASNESRSRSAVFHVPDRVVRKVPLVSSLSLRYNTSENFSPGGSRFDSFGKALALPSGATKDIGASLGLAGNRIVLTGTWFETKQVNNTAASIGGLTRQIIEAWRLTTNMVGLGLNPNIAQVLPPPQYLLDLHSFQVVSNTGIFSNRGDIVLTQDAVSKGAEFEIFVNLTKNWRLTANVSRVQATRSNTGKAFYDLFFVQKTNGQTLYENWKGPAGQQTFTSEGGSRLSDQADLMSNSFYSQALQDGGPTSELRKWRGNVVTTYSFNERSRLRGWSIGSGGRWQDKIAIGFPITNVLGGTTRIPDVTKPFFGPTELTVDSWLRYERRILRDRVKLTVQGNVFNVLNDDELIPVGTQPTGAIAVYRIPAIRRYELSTKFEF